MSRRNHHGGRHHGRPHKPIERRPAAPSTLAPGSPPPAETLEQPEMIEPAFEAARPVESVTPVEIAPEPEPIAVASDEQAERIAVANDAQPEPLVAANDTQPEPEPIAASTVAQAQRGHDAAPPANGEARGESHLDVNGDALAGTCTAPQLRRFIKSRAYVPMHELRRRFAINGAEDDVTQVDVNAHRIYIGLPEREGRMLGELLRGGDVGFELSLDPISPIVVGVYPMRPVPRP